MSNISSSSLVNQACTAFTIPGPLSCLGGLISGLERLSWIADSSQSSAFAVCLKECLYLPWIALIYIYIVQLMRNLNSNRLSLASVEYLTCEGEGSSKSTWMLECSRAGVNTRPSRVLEARTHLPLLRECLCKQLLRAQRLPSPRVYSIGFVRSCIGYAVCWSA